MACIELYICYRSKLSITLKSKDLVTHGFQKIQTHPQKPTEAMPSFRKVSLPPAKYVYFSPLTSGLDTNLLPLTGPELRHTV